MQQFRAFFIVFLIAFVFLPLFGCSNQAGEDNHLEDPDEVKEIVEDPLDSDNSVKNCRDDEKPAFNSNSTFNHEVDIQVNGEIEYDKGEEWWKVFD